MLHWLFLSWHIFEIVCIWVCIWVCNWTSPICCFATLDSLVWESNAIFHGHFSAGMQYRIYGFVSHACYESCLKALPAHFHLPPSVEECFAHLWEVATYLAYLQCWLQYWVQCIPTMTYTIHQNPLPTKKAASNDTQVCWAFHIWWIRCQCTMLLLLLRQRPLWLIAAGSNLPKVFGFCRCKMLAAHRRRRHNSLMFERWCVCDKSVP